jgi:hypothetical protein
VSASKQKGTAFERLIADFLAWEMQDDNIDRRALTGGKDRGDISGVKVGPYRLTVECKNVRTMALSQWVKEAETEAGNDAALAGVVIHKRRGYGRAADQYVTMTARDLVVILKAVTR